MTLSRTAVHETPELMRRRLKAALRQARDDAEITQQDAANALDWSVSKIIRIEQGVVGVSTTDLKALLDLYRVEDEAQSAELLRLARGSKRQEWTHYKSVYSKESLSLFGSEAGARVIYKYEPTFVPGLFQTEEYARALLEGLGRDSKEIDLLVAARLERQELLEGENPPQLQFVLSETVVSRTVGSAGIMRRQLARIEELASRPGIFIQMLLFSAGAHPGMTGPFTILEFDDPLLDDVIYLENAGETITREHPEVIADYRNVFAKLKTMAAAPEELGKVLSDIAKVRF